MTTAARAQHEVRLLAVLAACRQALFPIPIITLYWKRQIGMSLSDIMLLQGLFALVVASADFPAGYLADRIGYRASLVIGQVLAVLGWVLYAAVTSVSGVVLAECTLACSIAFISGADSALLYTALARQGATEQYVRHEGRMQAVAQSSEAVTSACGGALYAVAPSLPFILQVPAALVGLGAVFRLPPVAGTAAVESHLARALRLLRHTLVSHARLRTAMMLSVVLGLSSFTLVWLVQPYMEARGVPEPLFGPIWALANWWVGVMALLSHRVAARIGRGTTLMVCCVCVAAGYGCLAQTTAWYGFLFYFFIMTTRGLQIPLLRQALQDDAPAEDRAAVLSLNTMLFRLSFVVVAPIVAGLVAQVTLDTALRILGGVYTTTALLALAAFRRQHGQ